MNFEKPVVPPAERRRSPETRLEFAVRETVSDLRRELQEKYADLEYHGPAHSETVLSRTAWFLDGAPDATPEDKKLAEAAAMGHDVVQDYEWKPNLTGAGWKRMRKKGENEEASAERVIALLKEHAYELSDDEATKIRSAIVGTVPEFSMEYGTIVQPRVGPYSDHLAWALSAADLTTAGISPMDFLQEGDQVFCEEYMFQPLEDLDDAQAEKIYNEAIRWNESQIDFAKGQWDYWNRPVVPQYIKDKLTLFHDSVKMAQNRLERRKGLLAPDVPIKEKLQTLLEDMRFSRFGSPEAIEKA
jgi:hypothetical protein